MRLLLLRLVLLALARTSLAQNGYNYPRPDKPFVSGAFSGDSPGKSRDMPGNGPNDAFKPGRPSSNNGFTGSNGPGGTDSGYPGKNNGYQYQRPGYTSMNPGVTPQYGQMHTTTGYSESPSTGYPRQRPSVPFFEGSKPNGNKPSVGVIPANNLGGPTGSGTSGERPGYPRTGNGYSRGPNDNKPRGPDMGYTRGPNDNNKPRGPDVGYTRGPNGNNKPRGPDVGYTRGPNGNNKPRGPDDGYTRGPNGNNKPRGPDDGYTRGPDVGFTRGPDVGFMRGSPSGPGESYLSPRPGGMQQQRPGMAPGYNRGPTSNGQYPGNGSQRPPGGAQGSQDSYGGYYGSSPATTEGPGFPGTTNRYPTTVYNGGSTSTMGHRQPDNYYNADRNRQEPTDSFSKPGQSSRGPQQNGYSNNRGTQGGESPSGGPGSYDDSRSHDHQDDEGQNDGDYSAIPGQPGSDYPIYTEIPRTSFQCDAQEYPGYYADVEAQCQVFHICANNKTYDFLCPNGTIFNQQFFVCVWWNQFDCNSAPSLFYLNQNLYDYTIRGNQASGNQGFQDSSAKPQGQQYPDQATGPPSRGGGGYTSYQSEQGGYNRKPSSSQGQQDRPGGYPSNNGQQGYSPVTPAYGGQTTPQRPQGPDGSNGYSQGSRPSTDYLAPSYGSYPGRPDGPQRGPGDSNNYSPSPPGYYGPPSDGRRPTSDQGRSQSNGPGKASRPAGIPDLSKPNREYLPPRN